MASRHSIDFSLDAARKVCQAKLVPPSGNAVHGRKFLLWGERRRSKLVRLTRKGGARYRELNAGLLSIASTMGVALSEADIRKAVEIMRQLSDDVKAGTVRLS